MIINMHLRVGQLGDQAAAAHQPGLGQAAGQLIALRPLPNNDCVPVGRGLQQRYQVERLLVSVQPPHKGQHLDLLVDVQLPAYHSLAARYRRDDGRVQPHRHQPAAGHAQAFQFGGHSRGLGIGGRLAVHR